MAACGCRIRPNTPRFSSTSRGRTSTGRRSGSSACTAAPSRTCSCSRPPIWVHLTYQTAFVDNAGKLQMRRDVYNLDSRTLAAIKSERGNLEPAPERKREEIARSSPRKPATARTHRRSSAADLPVGNTARALIYLFPALSERAQDREHRPQSCDDSAGSANPRTGENLISIIVCRKPRPLDLMRESLNVGRDGRDRATRGMRQMLFAIPVLSENHIRTYWWCSPGHCHVNRKIVDQKTIVCTENLIRCAEGQNPAILVVKAAENHQYVRIYLFGAHTGSMKSTT